MLEFDYKGVHLRYAGKQSEAKARAKAAKVDEQVRKFLKTKGGGPFDLLGQFCSAHNITRGGGRENLAKQLLAHTQGEQKKMQQVKANGAASAARLQQEHEDNVKARAFAWFYGTELGCAYLAQVFRLQNRDPSQGTPAKPTAKQVAQELSKTLDGADMVSDIKIMEGVFEEILKLPRKKVVDLFRSTLQPPKGQTLEGRYYRAEVLNGPSFRPGAVLRTQAPTSISGRREKAEEFFEHRAGFGGANILYVFDNPPARRLQTALDKSSTGESEGIVPDRTFFSVAHVAKKGDCTEVHLAHAGEEAQNKQWRWMGHDAGLRLPPPQHA
ncbi:MULTISPECIES: hypothetical protein [unclassified Streptomyces]|uniref:hypothetical protein n=1 Tax=unclassified Streptomyces TaxID=2593676 RepID=UPI00380BFC91